MITKAHRDLFPEDNDQQFACRVFAMRCIAHRLKKWGFESGLNLLSPEDKFLLSSLFDGLQKEVLINAAISERKHES